MDKEFNHLNSINANNRDYLFAAFLPLQVFFLKLFATYFTCLKYLSIYNILNLIFCSQRVQPKNSG